MKIKLFTIPNLLTLSNLFCGSVAVVSALVWGDLKLAFGLMVLAAVFDFFDGFAARLLNQSSPIGLQLDSLADDISFGLAPAAIMYSLYQWMPGIWLPKGIRGWSFSSLRPAPRCGWRNSISTTRSARSSADCPARRRRCFAVRWGCCSRPADWNFRARRFRPLPWSWDC